MVRSLNKFVLCASALLLLVSFWERDALPGGIAFRPELTHEPVQKPTAKKPFTVDYAGVRYAVEPQFEYELYGMVVSYRQHDGKSFMHRMSNDHLNMADLCVVWSDTAFSPTLHKVKFWNGIFTCNYHTSDNEAWAAFKQNQVSNNHLISADPLIRGRVGEVHIGDQVRIRGWLSRYGSGAGMRGTSTTRDDTGDGACETIFVADFAIVAPASSGWRLAMYLSLAVLAVALAVHFKQPYRPYAD